VTLDNLHIPIAIFSVICPRLDCWDGETEHIQKSTAIEEVASETFHLSPSSSLHCKYPL